MFSPNEAQEASKTVKEEFNVDAPSDRDDSRASDPETVHVVLWQDKPGRWGTWADLSQAGVKVCHDAKEAMSFYNDKRVAFILDASPGLTADELEADFFDNEREELLRAIRQDVPYGQYDLRMVTVPSN